MTQCLICDANAVQFDNGLDGVEQKCPDCGHFALGGTFIATLWGRRLDVEQTRAWLASFREERPMELPVINDTNVFWR